MDKDAGTPTLIISQKISFDNINSLKLNVIYACFLIKSIYKNIIKTDICDMTVAKAAPLTPIPKPILP